MVTALDAQRARDTDTRERILQAAAAGFAAKGYAGATTRSIASEAGINEVTLFRLFGSKENLFSAVIAQHTGLSGAVAEARAQLTGVYRDDLSQIAHLLIQRVSERRDVHRVMLCEAERFPRLYELLDQDYCSVFELLVDYLQQQKEQGQVRDVAPEVMARAFWGMIFSHAMNLGIAQESLMPDEDRTRAVDHYVDLFVSGTLAVDLRNSTMNTAVAVEAVTRRFKGLVAVDELSFAVERGEVFGLLGPNGAGKTTTINLITGMLTPTTGCTRVLGRDPLRDGRWVRQHIGLVPQETNVYQDLSAIDNMWHHAALYVSDLSQVSERIRELLVMTNLWERRKDPVRTFSGGMKRRLALARTLLHDPEVILFDEPTLGVDVQGKHAIWEHIRSLRDRGKTFVVSTNDMSEAEALCDRLVIIDHGRAIAMGTPETLKAQLKRDLIMLRTLPPIDDPEALFGGLGVHRISRPEPGLLRLEVTDADRILGEVATRASARYSLESILMSRPSLDDVFLHHTGRALRE